MSRRSRSPARFLASDPLFKSRRGRFVILDKWLEMQPEACIELFKGAVITKMRRVEGGTMYQGMNRAFRALKCGQGIPTYRAELVIEHDGDHMSHAVNWHETRNPDGLSLEELPDRLLPIQTTAKVGGKGA